MTMKTKETVLITGAGGQLGSFSTELFADRGYRVIACGGTAPKNGIRIDLDITNPDRVNEAIKLFNPDILINYAAQSSPAISIEDPIKTFEVNQYGVLNILEAIRLHSRKTRGIFIGSSTIFNKKVSAYETFDDVVVGYQDEQTPMDPKTPYAASKAAAHSLVDTYRSCYGLNLFNVIQFGAESSRRSPAFFTKKVTHWISTFNSILRSERAGVIFEKDHLIIGKAKMPKLIFNEPLDGWKDLSYATDATNAHFILATEAKPGNYVVGSGEAHSLEEFVIKSFKFAQLENYEDFCIIPKSNTSTLNMSFNTYICSRPDKLRKLGWKPLVSFDSMVFSLVNDELINQGIRL